MGGSRQFRNKAKPAQEYHVGDKIPQEELTKIQDGMKDDVFIPDWFMRKLETDGGQSTKYMFDSNHGKVVKETEKAYMIELDYETIDGEWGGRKKVWVPKSVAQTYEQAQQSAQARVDRRNAAFAELDRLIQLGRDNGVKGLRRGMKRSTIESMLRQAGIEF